MALTTPAPLLRLMPHRPARRAVHQHPATTTTTTATTATQPPAAPTTAPMASATTAATTAAASWPVTARALMVDLAVAALAATALAERSDGSLLPVTSADASPAGGASGRRARALADHLADTCAALRHDLTVQQLVVLPVLRTAPLGLRTAVVRASCQAVVTELEAVEHGASLLTEGSATPADLRELAAALRRTRAAVAAHRRLWSDQAMPLARELLRERSDLVPC